MDIIKCLNDLSLKHVTKSYLLFMIILIFKGLIVSWWRTSLTYSENWSPFSETLDVCDTYCKHKYL